MILHLLFDEKFSDYVIEQFASPEMLSNFVLVSPTRTMKYFHHLEAVRIVNPREEAEMQLLLTDISNYKTVIFHGLFEPWQAWLLNHWPNRVKIAWVCWGGEIYGQPDIRTSFLKPISKLAYWLHNFQRRKECGIFPKKLISKADYCLTNLVSEYEYVRNYLGTDIKHLSYNYYTIDDTLGALKETRIIGQNIFIGNSASIECNYLDILLRLKRIGVGNRQIVLPLSYGEIWVRNMCMKFGRKLFGNRFAPLIDFMPRDEYNKTMLDCAVMIQPHLREQAHGNILTGLWLGMRVYLSENGIDYQHFKSIGCCVFSIEKDLKRNNPEALLPLSDDDVAHNRQVLMNVYGRECINRANKELVKQLA